MFRANTQLEAIEWLIGLGPGAQIAAITGRPGVGKTTVAAALAARLQAEGRVVVQVCAPDGGPLDLQRQFARSLGLAAGPQLSPAAVAAEIRHRQLGAGAQARIVLVIDGAEAMPAVMLQYAWLMHRLCNIGGPAIQTVLFGRCSLWETLNNPELAEMQAATTARWSLLPLTDDEALSYLRYRMRRAGAPAADLPRRLSERVSRSTEGIPARLNRVAEAAIAGRPGAGRPTARDPAPVAAGFAAEGPRSSTEPRRRRVPRWALAGGVGTALAASWLLLIGAPDTMRPRRATIAVVDAATGPQTSPPPARPPAAAAVPPRVAVAVPAVAAASMPMPWPPKSAAPRVAMVAPPPLVATSAPPKALPVRAEAPVPPSALAASVAAPAPDARPPTSPPAIAVATPPVAKVEAPAASAAEASVAPAPALVVLPDLASPRVSVRYSPGNPAAPALALALASRLRARGLAVGEPVASAEAVRSTTVEYFFSEDRGQAMRLAREVGGPVAVGQVQLSREFDTAPPGTLRVVLSERPWAARDFAVPPSPVPVSISHQP